MSYFEAEVVKIKLEPHPNADSLSLVRLEKPFAVTVVANTEAWQGKDLAIYCPIDGILQPNNPEYDWIGKGHRIKAKKLRGIFSQGILIPALDHHKEGDIVTEEIGLTKWEESELTNKTGIWRTHQSSVNVKPPHGEVKYTDIESLRRYPDIFVSGEPVKIYEKIHGANFRTVYQDGKLHLGSRTRWLEDENPWTYVAEKNDLENKLIQYPNYIFFGEAYGQVQDLKYGLKSADLIIFDIFSIVSSRYLSIEAVAKICGELELKIVPLLHGGAWQGFEWAKQFAEGQSLLGPNVREGFVVRPEIERWDERVGRVILKLHGTQFLLRK